MAADEEAATSRLVTPARFARSASMFSATRRLRRFTLAAADGVRRQSSRCFDLRELPVVDGCVGLDALGGKGVVGDLPGFLPTVFLVEVFGLAAGLSV